VFGNNILRCVVEDNKDPKFLGRVRLRVLGVHSPKIFEVRTDELPWSDVLRPAGEAHTLGGTTNVPVGTWGYCIPLNEGFTEFLMIGAIGGRVETPIEVNFENESIGFRNINDSNYPFPLHPGEPCNPLEVSNGDHSVSTYTPITVDSFTEPEDTDADVEYPHNNVYQDHNGNVIEIDGTKNNPRIKVTHSTGTRITINKKGDISLQGGSSGNIFMETPGLIALDGDGNMIIEGDLKVTGSIESGGEVADSQGNLSSLRGQFDANVTTFNSHTHPSSDPTNHPPTVLPTQSQAADPKTRFIWVGTPV